MRISDWSSDVCSSDLLSSYELLRGDATVAECAIPTAVPRLDIVSATVDLSGAEIELIEFQDRLHRLQQALSGAEARSEEHTSELQTLMRNSYADSCLKKKKKHQIHNPSNNIKH